MRKMAPVSTPVVASVEAKPVLICKLEGCGRVLPPAKRKFCSNVCKHAYLSTGANGGGRLTDTYKPEYAAVKMDEYLAFCKAENDPILVPTNSGFIVIPKAMLPSKPGFANFIGTLPYNLDTWSEKHPDFARAMDHLHAVQHEFVLNDGIAGRYNPQIAKLVLTNNHGMVERKQVDTTHKMIGIVRHLYERADELEREARAPQLPPPAP